MYSMNRKHQNQAHVVKTQERKREIQGKQKKQTKAMSYPFNKIAIYHNIESQVIVSNQEISISHSWETSGFFRLTQLALAWLITDN